MWFNSSISEEPYLGLKRMFVVPKKLGMTVKSEACTGAARSSSARAVRCSVQSGNERNPYPMLYFSWGTAPVNGEEGGDDVRSAWPLCPGLHTCYNGRDKGSAKPQGEANPIKRGLSSDCGLQLAHMKPESLVTVDQQCHGEYVLESCTHRPSSEPSRQYQNRTYGVGR